MIVLDTHAWVWWAAGSSKLSAASRKRIAGSEKIGVSAISASTQLDPKFHGDPADRIIVATAMLSQATLVTRDRRIRRSGIVECVLA
jgi:PIN domain nuclease of toxin-antitoxin system